MKPYSFHRIKLVWKSRITSLFLIKHNRGFQWNSIFICVSLVTHSFKYSPIIFHFSYSIIFFKYSQSITPLVVSHLNSSKKVVFDCSKHHLEELTTWFGRITICLIQNQLCSYRKQLLYSTWPRTNPWHLVFIQPNIINETSHIPSRMAFLIIISRYSYLSYASFN